MSPQIAQISQIGNQKYDYGNRKQRPTDLRHHWGSNGSASGIGLRIS